MTLLRTLFASLISSRRNYTSSTSTRDPRPSSRSTWTLSGSPYLNRDRVLKLIRRSTTAEIEGTEDEFIVGAKYGYAFLTRSNGKLEYIKHVWNEHEGPGKAKR